MNGLSRRDFLRVTGISVAALAAGTALDACGSSTSFPTTSPSSGQQQVRRLRLASTSFGYPSPFAMSRGPGFIGMSFLFDQLLWEDNRGLRPWLAESYTFNEKTLTATFKIHSGAQFHDGTPVTPQDVAFSVDYVKAHPMPWFINTFLIDKVTPLDTQSVQITLKRPNATFLLGDVTSLPILPEHIWANVADPYKFRDPTALVGSGPYKLTEFDDAQGTYRYQASDGYYLGNQLVREIDYVPAADPLLALLKGDIDAGSPSFSQGISADALKPFQSNSKFDILKGVGDGMTALYFNIAAGAPYNDIRFRQALAYAIDRRELVDRVLQGSGTQGNPGWLAPGGPWFNGNVPQYAYDAAAARSLLDQAGYTQPAGSSVRQGPDGKLLSLPLIFNSTGPRVAEVIQSQLQKVGVEVKPQGVDSASLRSLATQGQYHLAILGLGGLSGDPDFNFESFNSKAPQGQQNFTKGHGYSSAQFDSLQARQRVTLDPATRKKIVDQQQQVFATDLPALSLYYPPRLFIFNRQRFGGWYYTPGGIAGGQPSAENKATFVSGPR